jgi:GyrI-like small molecule binding domain
VQQFVKWWSAEEELTGIRYSPDDPAGSDLELQAERSGCRATAGRGSSGSATRPPAGIGPGLVGRPCAALARGEATVADSHRGSWERPALIMQPDPIDADLIADAMAETAGKKALPRPGRLEYIRWAGGRCAQLPHVGPYAAEAPSIAALHTAIAEAGCRPRGRHHDLPRRPAPQKLRTIIRHPVERVSGPA